MRPSFLNAVASALLLLTLFFLPAQAGSAERTVITSQDADYFGFDLRTQADVSLDQCKALCLEEAQCRAFTYTSKQKWCFLKSDHGVVKPFVGAVAGRVVEVSTQPDIAPPAPLAFLPDYVKAEARQAQAEIGLPIPQRPRAIRVERCWRHRAALGGSARFPGCLSGGTEAGHG